MRDAGIIGFVPRGEYSPAETYNFLQFVYYNGSTYVAKKETTGNAPVENNEFWQILAKGQLTGVSGVKGEKETNFHFNPRPREGSDCKYCSFLLYQSSFLKQYSQISIFSNYTNIESTILIRYFPSANLSDISC